MNDLKDFVCLTSHCKCNSKCDDCSECENEIDKWLEEHDKQIRADAIAEISREMRVLYGNEYERQIRADAIEEFTDWLSDELITIHLFPDQRAKLYANIIRKKEQMQKGAENDRAD